MVRAVAPGRAAGPALEDFYLGIEDNQQKAAIDAANKFRRR